MTKALIDADILVHAIGFSTEEESEEAAILKMDTRIDEITFNCGASEYVLYLSGSSNFRKQLFPGYKAHRKQPKPKHYKALREYLINVEGAVVSGNEEADDVMSIVQVATKEEYDNTFFEPNWDATIIATLDKDLDCTPGWHYNWNKDESYFVTEAQAQKNFYRQLITGDSTDNIPGQHGVGPKKANDILEGCETVEQYNKAVFDSYKKHFDYCTEVDVLKHINIIGKLLYIRRQPDEEWSFAVD